MRTSSFAEKRFGLVILDEAQAIKNPGAKQTRAVKALQGTSRIALTGTPVENRLGDLWSLFDFLSPGLLGSAKEFGEAAKRMESSKATGFAPLRSLIKPYILRRMKTDKRVIDDLPEKTEMRAYCSLTKRQVALYSDAVRELERDLKAKDSDGMKRRGVVLAAIMRMKQICNHPSQLLGDGAFNPADSGKLDRLRELCEPIVARQEKLLCFTQFKEMTAPLETFLASAFGRRGLVLHGEVAVKKRASLVDEFQRDDGPPFFVLSLKAGGTGLNLTAATHVVHFDRWWNPAVEDQATDRAFRIGQKRNVMVHKLVCQGTLEEKIDALLADKRALSDDLLAESGERWLTEMSNDELMKIVSLDLSKAIGDA
jgi:SNF2 family DNA or RNA helicase